MVNQSPVHPPSLDSHFSKIPPPSKYPREACKPVLSTNPCCIPHQSHQSPHQLPPGCLFPPPKKNALIASSTTRIPPPPPHYHPIQTPAPILLQQQTPSQLKPPTSICHPSPPPLHQYTPAHFVSAAEPPSKFKTINPLPFTLAPRPVLGEVSDA